jgi:hypothetical protein
LFQQFVQPYVGSGITPDSTLKDQTVGYVDLNLDDFDFDLLHDVQTQDEFGGSRLGGAPPTWTQEGVGTQPGGSQLLARKPWDATRRVATARSERWGATVSRRVAKVVP